MRLSYIHKVKIIKSGWGTIISLLRLQRLMTSFQPIDKVKYLKTHVFFQLIINNLSLRNVVKYADDLITRHCEFLFICQSFFKRLFAFFFLVGANKLHHLIFCAAKKKSFSKKARQTERVFEKSRGI